MDDVINLNEIFSFKQVGLTANGEVMGEFVMSKKVPEVYKKIKRAGKSNLDYEWVKDKKLETKISNAEQLQYDLQKNNQKIFKNNFIYTNFTNF